MTKFNGGGVGYFVGIYKGGYIMKVLKISAIGLLFVLLMASCAGNDSTQPVQVSDYNALVTALAGDSSAIELTGEIDAKDVLSVTRKVTLDLNGHTISNASPIWQDTETVNKWSLISVGKGGELTVTGDGKIDALENDCYAFDVVDGGKLIIENGEFIGNISAVYVFEGSAEIKGGTFSIKQEDLSKGTEFTLNLYDKNREAETASIVVSGGEFIDFDPAANAAESSDNTTNFLDEGYKTVSKPSGDTTIYKVVSAAE